MLCVLLRDSVREGRKGVRGMCVGGSAVLTLGGSRLPCGHSDGKKVGNKCFCVPDLVSLKEERHGLIGCVCSESRLLAGAASAWQPLASCVGCGIECVRVHRHGAVSFELG